MGIVLILDRYISKPIKLSTKVPEYQFQWVMKGNRSWAGHLTDYRKLCWPSILYSFIALFFLNTFKNILSVVFYHCLWLCLCLHVLNSTFHQSLLGPKLFKQNKVLLLFIWGWTFDSISILYVLIAQNVTFLKKIPSDRYLWGWYLGFHRSGI